MVCDRDRNGERKNHKKAKIKGTKTTSGNRIVPLNTKAIAALKNLHTIYRKKGICSPNVVASLNGNMLSNDQLQRVLHRVLKYAEISKPFTLHQLRHTFATQTLNAGVPITVVSKWLGHANVSVTYNTYIHVLESVETPAGNASRSYLKFSKPLCIYSVSTIKGKMPKLLDVVRGFSKRGIDLRFDRSPIL